jgi:hypothetical protein
MVDCECIGTNVVSLRTAADVDIVSHVYHQHICACSHTTNAVLRTCTAALHCESQHCCMHSTAGTYSNQVGRSSLLDCVPAPPGQYVGTNGNTAPTGNCAAGYYCSGGSYLPNPG